MRTPEVGNMDKLFARHTAAKTCFGIGTDDLHLQSTVSTVASIMSTVESTEGSIENTENTVVSTDRQTDRQPDIDRQTAEG